MVLPERLVSKRTVRDQGVRLRGGEKDEYTLFVPEAHALCQGNNRVTLRLPVANRVTHLELDVGPAAHGKYYRALRARSSQKVDHS